MGLDFTWTIRFGIITPLLIVVAVLLAGGGHGYFEPIIFIFPMSAISVIFFQEIKIGFALLALIQYPLYGFLIDQIKDETNRKLIAVLIIVFHILIAFLIWIYLPQNFI